MVQLDASAGSAGMFAEQLVNTDPCPQMVCSYSSCCYWWGGANQPRANSQTNKEVIPGLFRFHPDSLLISKTLHQFTQTRSSACVRDWQSKQKEQEVFLTLYVKSIITKKLKMVKVKSQNRKQCLLFEYIKHRRRIENTNILVPYAPVCQ